MSRPFHIREQLAEQEDTDFLVAAFDSCISYCESVGSGGMWGSQLFSEKAGFLQATAEDVVASEKHRTTGEGEAVRIFIAERAAVGPTPPRQQDLCYSLGNGGTGTQRFLKVGAAQVKLNWFPAYVAQQAHLEHRRDEAKTAGDWGYIEVMISDFRTSDEDRKGVGAALMDYIKHFAVENSAKAIFVDAWSGNSGRLVR